MEKLAHQNQLFLDFKVIFAVVIVVSGHFVVAAVVHAGAAGFFRFVFAVVFAFFVFFDNSFVCGAGGFGKGFDFFFLFAVVFRFFRGCGGRFCRRFRRRRFACGGRCVFLTRFGGFPGSFRFASAASAGGSRFFLFAGLLAVCGLVFAV